LVEGVEARPRPTNADWRALRGTVNTALQDPHLPADFRAHLLAVRARVEPLRALGDLSTGLEAAALPHLNAETLEQLPEPVRRLWAGLEGLQEIGATLAGTSGTAPDSARLTRCLTDVHAATGDSRLTEALQGALIARAEGQGQTTLARALRDLKLAAAPVAPAPPSHVPMALLVPEEAAGVRPTPHESVWEGSPELKGPAIRASRQLYQQLTAGVRWHSDFHSSLAHTQAHLAFHLHRQTDPDERRAEEKRRALLAAVEGRLSRCLTPAERIIAADMLRWGPDVGSVADYLKRSSGH
jgi:hypothetical protein